VLFIVDVFVKTGGSIITISLSLSRSPCDVSTDGLEITEVTHCVLEEDAWAGFVRAFFLGGSSSDDISSTGTVFVGFFPSTTNSAGDKKSP